MVQELFDRSVLQKQSWFRNANKWVQKRLMALPGGKNRFSCDGILRELCERPTEFGGVRVLRLRSVSGDESVPVTMKDLDNGDTPAGTPQIFGLHFVWDVCNIASGAEYAYQFFSWRQGSLSGAKGVVCIQDPNGFVTSIVVLRASGFAPGKDYIDGPGGFMETLDATHAKAVLSRFLVEVQEELGLDPDTCVEVLDLGRMLVDPGMTNNEPRMFAAFFPQNDATLPEQRVNPDWQELDAKPFVIHVENLWNPRSPCFVGNIGSGLVSTAILRLLAHGRLPVASDWPYLEDPDEVLQRSLESDHSGRSVLGEDTEFGAV